MLSISLLEINIQQLCGVTGFRQFCQQVRIAVHQVVQVLHGRICVLREGELQSRQLPFGVRADAKNLFNHIAESFM